MFRKWRVFFREKVVGFVEKALFFLFLLVDWDFFEGFKGSLQCFYRISE